MWKWSSSPSQIHNCPAHDRSHQKTYLFPLSSFQFFSVGWPCFNSCRFTVVLVVRVHVVSAFSCLSLAALSMFHLCFINFQQSLHFHKCSLLPVGKIYHLPKQSTWKCGFNWIAMMPLWLASNRQKTTATAAMFLQPMEITAFALKIQFISLEM